MTSFQPAEVKQSHGVRRRGKGGWAGESEGAWGGRSTPGQDGQPVTSLTSDLRVLLLLRCFLGCLEVLTFGDLQ